MQINGCVVLVLSWRVPAVVAYFFCVKTPENTNSQKSENVFFSWRESLFLPLQRSAMSPMRHRQKRNKKREKIIPLIVQAREVATKCRH
jgi:hypothetical protein